MLLLRKKSILHGDLCRRLVVGVSDDFMHKQCFSSTFHWQLKSHSDCNILKIAPAKWKFLLSKNTLQIKPRVCYTQHFKKQYPIYEKENLLWKLGRLIRPECASITGMLIVVTFSMH